MEGARLLDLAGIHARLGSVTVSPLDGVVNFPSMNADVPGSIDPQTYSVAHDQADFDVGADHNYLVAFNGQIMHSGSPDEWSAILIASVKLQEQITRGWT